MTISPIIHAMQRAAGAVYFSFGQGGQAVEMVQTFGQYEAEYAAIRKGVGLLHQPQRGLLRLTGKDVKDFLHRMLTQDIQKLTGGSSRRALLLTEKGRILADLIVHHGDEDTWLEGDACDLPAVAKLLGDRLFSEDVTIENLTAQRVALSLHGPESGALLSALADDPQAVARMLNMPGTHHVLKLAGEPVTCSRRDLCASPGISLWTTGAHAGTLYTKLAELCGGLDPDASADAPTGGAKRNFRGRGIGWLAFNTARLEAGTALFHIDFGPDSLPHEAGKAVLDEAVSFTKGCYLGQEIVARMQNLGHPRKVLVGLRFTDDTMPVEAAPVYDPGQEGGAEIGAVTSAAVSPLLGNVAIALAMLKWGRHTPGVKVSVAAEGRYVPATVHTTIFLN